jgi:rhodanese-related sulfurtransferase
MHKSSNAKIHFFQGAYIIDVREAEEFAKGAIPSSINMPLSTLMESFKLPDGIFKERFGVNKPTKEQDLTFYCLKGLRSVTATDIARSNGYTKCVHSLRNFARLT